MVVRAAEEGEAEVGWFSWEARASLHLTKTFLASSVSVPVVAGCRSHVGDSSSDRKPSPDGKSTALSHENSNTSIQWVPRDFQSFF